MGIRYSTYFAIFRGGKIFLPALTVGESSAFDHSERLSALAPFIFGCVIAAFAFGRFGQVEYRPEYLAAGKATVYKSLIIGFNDNIIKCAVLLTYKSIRVY